jgi:SAM-dependent methyltransferase
MGNPLTSKERLKRVPVAGAGLARAARYLRRYTFPGSRRYWERRYARGGTSGAGSEGAHARFKAEFLNMFVARHNVTSVVEFGCGDGQQLSLANYPRYLGLDISPTVLARTMARFSGDPTKSFIFYTPSRFSDPCRFISADLAISLDVVYHLVEDGVYYLHLRHVFGAARRFVVLYTSDTDLLAETPDPLVPHVRHRPVMRDVARLFPEWRLGEHVPNRHVYLGSDLPGSFSDFLVFERSA